MPTNVAIACQGGGSHTAFAAGVLEKALRWIEDADARLVGISGTSGGAVSAVAAWTGYLAGGADAAVATLESVWADVAVSTPAERVANDWAVYGMEARNMGLPVPAFSPYVVPWTDLGQTQFRTILEENLDFEAIPEHAGGEAPKLVVGTVDVEAGTFETFEDGAVTADAVMASAAVPSVFEAVQVRGTGHWDGLFSQNPPITELLSTDYEQKPDELWVVQINPQTTDGVPKTRQGIIDRRRELSANIGLNQQVQFLGAVNDWVDAGMLPEDRFKHVEIRKLVLEREYSPSTKFRRTERFIEEVMAEGRETARTRLESIEADLADGENG